MLEQLHTTPEERRKTEIFLHVGVIAFALYNFAELAGVLGAAPLAAGIATGLSGVLYSRWLRTRWRGELRAARADHRPHGLRAV